MDVSDRKIYRTPPLNHLSAFLFVITPLISRRRGCLKKELLVVTCPSAGAQVLTKIIKIQAVETATKLSKT